MTLTFKLTCPIRRHGVLYASNKQGGIEAPTQALQSFFNVAKDEIERQGVKKLKGCYTLHVMAAPPKSEQGNYNFSTRAILELLAELNIVESALYPYCQGVSCFWSQAVDKGVIVSVRPAQQQITAEVA